MVSSFAETFGENRLDAVNFSCRVAGRDAGHFPDRSGIHAFQVEKNYLPVERVQALNQREEPLEHLALLDGVAGIVFSRNAALFFEFFKADMVFDFILRLRRMCEAAVLCATRYTQVRSEQRPSKPAKLRHMAR